MKKMKIKFNSDHDFPLKKTLELRNIVIVANNFKLKNVCLMQLI